MGITNARVLPDPVTYNTSEMIIRKYFIILTASTATSLLVMKTGRVCLCTDKDEWNIPPTYCTSLVQESENGSQVSLEQSENEERSPGRNFAKSPSSSTTAHAQCPT